MDPLSFSGDVETVVGNGRLVARVRAGSAEFVYGGPASGYRLLVDGRPPTDVTTEVWPGRTRYVVAGRGAVTVAADPDADVLAVLVEAAGGAEPAAWTLDLTARQPDAEGAPGSGPGPAVETARGVVAVWGGAGGAPEVRTPDASSGTLTVRVEPGGRAAFLLGDENAVGAVGDAAEAVGPWAARYAARGLRLKTPDATLDRAVAFARAHHQLGYDWTPGADGRPGGPSSKLVCDIFRWRDVWSRDFGSGFGPGGIAAGMTDAVLATLDYEAARHAAHDPAGLKVSDDASQGGSAEGLGWTLSLVWLVYLHTGDRDWLGRMADAFFPWVEVWIGRQRDGLVVDSTEWMDHSRFLRLPEGQRTLYSNALWAAALDRSAHVADALGRADAAGRYRRLAERARQSVRRTFWNEDGHFNNAVQWGVPDTALMLADTAVACTERIGSAAERARALAEVRARLWRPFGTVTCSPPMRYVADENDHNAKVWPWWMAWEAKARFLHGDVEGGLLVLGKIADTFGWPTFPGLCEEYFDAEDGGQDAVAGHAFITGSGAFLDAVQRGLVGLEVCAPGERHVRLAPAAPRAWDAWEADLDLVAGRLALRLSSGGIDVDLDRTRVERLDVCVPSRHAVRVATVDGEPVEPTWDEDSGATLVQLSVPAGGRHTVRLEFAPSPGALSAAFRVGRAFTLSEPAGLPDGLDSVVGTVRSLGAGGIGGLGGGDVLAVAGNAVPYRTASGDPVPEALAAFLDRGGALLLLGPRAADVDVEAPYHGGAQMGGHARLLRWQVQENGRWADVDGLPDGAVYWGEGPLFPLWEHEVGLFGIGLRCRGVADADGADLDPDVEVGSVYTDWAVRAPWAFWPLAYTRRVRQLVVGPRVERAPCAALLHNRETGGRVVVVAPAVCARPGLLRPVLRRALAAA